MSKIEASPALMQAIETSFAAADVAVEGGEDIVHVYGNIAERMLAYILASMSRAAVINDVGVEAFDAAVKDFLDKLTDGALARAYDAMGVAAIEGGEGETKH